MSPLEIGAILFGALLFLLAIGTPVGVAMFLIGGGGYVMLSGWGPLINFLSLAPMEQVSSYSLSVIPLFLLMGQFATHAGLSRGLFNAANHWLGHYRGGIAMAAVGACAVFGSICGSSLATAATMSQVSLPEMRRLKYSGALSTGSLAAGGTLGILIPPSVVMVIYAVLTEQSIGKLFIAAIVPGLMAAAGYFIAIRVYVALTPNAGPAGPRRTLMERIASLREVWPVVIIFAVVIGGIYGGWFSPTEGAAIGAAGTGLIALARRTLDRRTLIECLKGTAGLTAMIFLIFIGAELYNAALALSRLPFELKDTILALGLSPYLVLAVIIVFYLILGCVMDAISMILLTMPVFFPIMMGLDFGLTPEHTAIWFGILALMVVEIGLITPPVGMNIFVISAIADDVPIQQTFRGVVPFIAADAVRILLLAAFPAITLFALQILN